MPLLDDDEGLGGIPAYQVLEGVLRPSEYRKRYAAEIRALDEQLERLVEGAERATADSGLVVLVTSDHGEHMGEDGAYFSHGRTTSPGVAHVPMILVAPGLDPGRSDEFVHHMDVLPTLVERVGLEVPPEAEGLALGRAWLERVALPDRALFSDVGRDVTGYRGDRFEHSHTDEDGARTHRAYRWNQDGSWSETEPDAELREQVAAYVSREWNERPAPKPSRADIERLRALGYIERGGDAPNEAARSSGP